MRCFLFFFIAILMSCTTNYAPSCVNLNEQNFQSAFQNGYNLIPMNGLARSDFHREVVLSYIDGIKTRIKELEFNMVSASKKLQYEKKENYDWLSNPLLDFKEGDQVADILNKLNNYSHNSKMKNFESTILKARSLLYQSKSLLQ